MLYGTTDNTNFGFYFTDDKNKLKTCVEITDTEWKSLLDGQSAGKQIAHDTDGKPILKDYVDTTMTIEKYKNKVVELIREKYSIDDEDDMINKGIADATDAEYTAYRAFVAECKSKAKEEIGIE
jgi:hypothetical protein